MCGKYVRRQQRRQRRLSGVRGEGRNVAGHGSPNGVGHVLLVQRTRTCVPLTHFGDPATGRDAVPAGRGAVTPHDASSCR